MRELSVVEITGVAGGDAESDAIQAAIAQAIALGLVEQAVAMGAIVAVSGLGFPIWWAAFPFC